MSEAKKLTSKSIESLLADSKNHDFSDVLKPIASQRTLAKR
ncbi:hypothetical protein [Geitlerinema sp. PCC 7407]|nr:hypothetical protein [Geitlerinema sp. PCC 7407]